MADSGKFIVSELLCFLYNHYGKVPKSEIIATLTGFYADDEVVRAKELLFDFADCYEPKVESLPRLKVRREGNNRRRLECEDIMGLAEVLDKRGVVLPEFYAMKLHRLPRISPSDVDNVRMAETVEDLKHQVTVLTAQFAEVKNLLSTARGSQPVQATVAPENRAAESMIHSSNPAEEPALTGERGSTFATLLQSSEEQGEWFTVSRRAGKSKMTTMNSRKIVGKGDPTSSTRIKAASAASRDKKWHIFVGRLDPATTEEDLTAFLSDSNISTQSCKLLEAREDWQKNYAAFRVVVDYVHKDDVFEKVVWPLGTDVRDWVFTNRKHDGEQS